ncbi:cation-translocating P-type ATPase [Thermogladius sp.]|uniref:cation-translocating P-type ATPase n=1 Tax=Thermogladius sp. TaxID=2023064 RepID=UPI003D13DF2C
MGQTSVEIAPWHSLSVEEVLERLGSSLRGLSEEEAERRLQAYGPNILEAKRKHPALIFARQFTNALILILVAASVISGFLGEILDAALILAVVFVMGVMGFVQEYRAERALQELRKLASPTAKVVRGGVTKVVEASRLVPGDIVLVEEGDRVPADLRLVLSDNLEVDESSLTGESTPVQKDHEQVLPPETPLGDRVNMAFMGTTVVRGRGRGVVVATGPRTVLGGITRAVEEAEEQPTPLEVELEDLGRKVGFVILGISGVVFATTLLVEKTSVLTALLVAIALAVAAVPEGLPAIATGLLAIGARKMAEKKALVRRLAAVEALGSVNVICTDKTGTVTRGEMMVKYLWTTGGEFEFTGEGFRVEGEARPITRDADDRLLEKVGELALAHTAYTIDVAGLESLATRKSPTELAVFVMGVKVVGPGRVGEVKEKYRLVSENPFDRFRKMRSTVHEHNGGLVSVATGAPEVVLKNSAGILRPAGEEAITPLDVETVMKRIEYYSSQGFRVLGIAYKRLSGEGDDPENGLVFAGLMAIIDPPREGVREAVEEAKRMGVRTVMVTGDHKLTAMAVARMIGLEVGEDSVLEGWQLDRMSDEELERVVDKVVVYARVTPEHKLRIVRALKKRGYRVAMTGDGVNDAPALKEADVGVAMGVRGTDVAKEVSQLVLLDDNYATIVEAIKMGRLIYENLKKPISYLLSCNLGEVGSVFGAELLGLPYILEPVHLLWINVTTDAFPALALGLEPPEPGLYTRPPRPRGARLVTGKKLLYYTLTGLVIAAFTIGLFAQSLSKGLEYARTVAFTTIALSEFGRAVASRSERHSLFRLAWNKWLPPALLASLGLQLIVLYTPLNSLFHVVPLGPVELAVIAFLPSAAIILIDEVRKKVWVYD